MNAVLGMSELLLSEPLTEKQLSCVIDIKIASQSLLTIVNDILDLSKLKAGKLSLVPIHYDLSQALNSIRSMAFFLAKEKDLRFRFESDDTLPKCLYGDDGRLRQILLNVIGNAIKFTRHGEVALLVAKEEGQIRFDISDTGIGIKQEDVAGLFDAFSQADAHKNRDIKGTGLGLAISKSLVDSMGGSIDVHSEYGKGTTFSIRIPLIEGDPDKIEHEESLLVEFHSGAKILVVDDKEINLRVAKGLIELFEIECHIAMSGEQALTMLKHEQYDLIFMDHLMPDMDGLETTRRIREMGGRRATVPIIALSASVGGGLRETFLSAGMNDFLSKPIERRRLQTILSKWMPRHSDVAQQSTRLRSETEARKKTDAVLTGKPSTTISSFFGDRRPRTLAEMAQGIPGLDVDMGLKHVSGNQELYEELLNLASETMPAIVDGLEQAAKGNDTQRLLIEIHGAKGSLASIGAVELADQAAALEKAVEAGAAELNENMLPAFLEGLRLFGERLQELFVVFSSPNTVIYGNRTQLAARMHQLMLALSTKNEKQITKLIKSVTTRDFGPATNAQLDKLRIYIDAGDYAAAAKFISSIVAALGNGD